MDDGVEINSTLFFFEPVQLGSLFAQLVPFKVLIPCSEIKGHDQLLGDVGQKVSDFLSQTLRFTEITHLIFIEQIGEVHLDIKPHSVLPLRSP
jgi:hypothetical protein